MDTVRALAKLTVSLKVVGIRADGYHLLDAEMVTLAHHDTLTFDGDRPTALTVDGPAGAKVPTDESNLVLRALRAVGRTAAVHITKRIRPGGGLGGGSADAAAVLRWAGCNDIGFAAKLGADIPFCVVGGRARVTGIGDVLEPMPFEETAYTLCTPPFGVSTPVVFRAWDELGVSRSTDPNDLESAALTVEPRLLEWRDRFAAATGLMPVLAGSGSTWFVPGAFHDLDDKLAGADVVVTRTDRP